MKYQDSAVAFVDVLGFSELVRQSAGDAKSLADLNELVDLLEQAVPDQDSKVLPAHRHLCPTFTYISDCIILSSDAATSGMPDALERVVLRCIQLTHHFIEQGYLLRGGIAVGPVWHHSNNVVGPAYQEAFDLEGKMKHPFIGLSQDAIREAMQGTCGDSRMYIELPSKYAEGSPSAVIVNGLHEFYAKGATEFQGITSAYERFKDICSKGARKVTNASASAKWTAFEEYLVAEASEDPRRRWSQAF